MMVPTPRLIVCYGLLATLLTLVPVFSAQSVSWPAVAATGLAFAAIALADSITAVLRLRRVTLVMPDVVRLTKGREALLSTRLFKSHGCGLVVRVGLLLPAQIEASQQYVSMKLASGPVDIIVAWPCTPWSRGEYRVEISGLETRSFLGLWDFRRRDRVSCAIRVYPNLFVERAGLSTLFLNRDSAGIHARLSRGKGREFERLREYMPGDGYDEIHWKATAKRRRPITKVFQIERVQEVYVIIDSSRLSARISRGGRRPDNTGQDRDKTGALSALDGYDTQLDRFITAALLLGQAAKKQGDLFGLAAFSDSVHHFIRAAGGKSHYGACRDYVYSLFPRIVTPDYEELFSFVRLRLKRRALLMILTNLDDPVLAESYMRGIDLVCRHHLVLTAMFRPNDAQPIFSHPLSPSDDIHDLLSGHVLWHNLHETESDLKRKGVEFALLGDERFCANLVSRYMEVKQRQAL
jgi:uncharacterized protein (DUF58 family)